MQSQEPKDFNDPSSVSQGLNKVIELKDTLGQRIDELRFDAKFKYDEIKSKLSQSYGDLVNSLRDLDDKARELLRKVNEEVRKLPKRKERIIETQGKEIQEKIKQVTERFKDGAFYLVERAYVQIFGERVDPARDLDEKTKKQAAKVFAEIRKLPPRKEMVIETQGLQKVKGGVGVDISNKMGVLFEEIQKIPGKISEKVIEVREKVQATFKSVNKENAVQGKENAPQVS